MHPYTVIRLISRVWLQELIQPSEKIATSTTTGIAASMKYYRSQGCRAWATALYRFSVRLISRTHGWTATAAAATHTFTRTHGAYITRVRACTHVRTPRRTARRKALTIYFIWLIRFRQRRYSRRLREFNLRARVLVQGRFVLDIVPQVVPCYISIFCHPFKISNHKIGAT